uniref:MICOS complex subunit n=1 Tax=Steinernema glaseri TaxID=37863 RepID=A0A1I7ZD01_9BILA
MDAVNVAKEKITEFGRKWWALTTADRHPKADPKNLKTVADLPIYAEDEKKPEYKFVEEDPLPLQTEFASIRYAFRDQYDLLTARFQTVEKATRCVKRTICKTDEYLRNEWTVLPKAAAITVGGLAGFVLGLKHGAIRRTLYTATGLTTMAAFCYPNETVDFVRTGIAHSEQAWEQFQDYEDCRWTKFEEVVTGDHFSLRIEPVIRSNEYIRNVVMERPNTQFAAKAQMRLEICRFRTHRQHCNRELMPEEDKRLYDLLLLRLSRASLLTRNVTITAPPMVPTAAARFEAQPSAFVDSDINRIDSTKNDLKRLHRDNPIVKVDTDNNTVDQGGERCRRRSKRTLGETEACHGVFKSCCEAKVGEKCRDICSLKADKTTINEILKKRNCPLLSLISVLRCFNDVYDTSSVATCCRAADKRIPSQCHDACSPNFKLSYKHLHCVEHVVDVYHCYRTLFSETPFHVNK